MTLVANDYEDECALCGRPLGGRETGKCRWCRATLCADCTGSPCADCGDGCDDREWDDEWYYG